MLRRPATPPRRRGPAPPARRPHRGRGPPRARPPLPRPARPDRHPARGHRPGHVALPQPAPPPPPHALRAAADAGDPADPHPCSTPPAASSAWPTPRPPTRSTRAGPGTVAWRNHSPDDRCPYPEFARTDEMLAPTLAPARHRGVILILVLAILALMALIGVTFATFAGQGKINARNFAQSVLTPRSRRADGLRPAAVDRRHRRRPLGPARPQPGARHVRQRRPQQRLPRRQPLHRRPVHHHQHPARGQFRRPL